MATQSNDNSSTPQYRLIDGRYKIVPQPRDFVHEMKDVLHQIHLYDDDWELKVRTSSDGHLIFRHYNCKCDDIIQYESVSSSQQ
jgi:hypothetical protein